ncbi:MULTISPECIES: MarR family winged helix-turn-helix transcriptional regulator [unclassified Sinorhizobium]|uniref:MarR family winged helix-turn-helix transcriptional regulator n=1 Tax=unclassified Sinorhizobium TaxID=2613772 RepID=UPI00352437A7
MPGDFDNDLLVLLADVARHIRTYADCEAQSLGLTRAQLIILARLEAQPDISQNELAAAAEVTATTIARLIDRLEELGLVERSHDPADRRIWRLRVTPAGTSLMHEIGDLRARLNSALTAGISPTVLKATVSGLRQMKENVSKCLTRETSA